MILQMSKRFIFVSCGQFTQAEKSLGSAICNLVKEATGMDTFFAEDVQDLNGLDDNILNALRHCSGFITVLHPRGTIMRPDHTTHTRASVWIEQEIAIATYIRRIEKRELPVMAFIHEDVGLEGIRSLLQLNPKRFMIESQILDDLRVRLLGWKNLASTGLSLEVEAPPIIALDTHNTRELIVRVVNNSNRRIDTWEGEVQIPAAKLAHWRNSIGIFEPNEWEPLPRTLRFSQEDTTFLPPRSKTVVFKYQYCGACLAAAAGGIPYGGELEFVVRIWIDGEEYQGSKTIQQLAMEAEGRSR
jgi:hypothetical protein